MILIATGAAALEPGLGDTVRVVYDVPEGYSVDSRIDPAPEYFPLDQRDGVVTLLALALDTLPLPPLRAIGSLEGDTVMIEPPPVIIARVRQDSSMTVLPFPGPAPVSIPPGLPSDYLRPLMFWVEWGGPPPPHLLVWILLALLAVTGTAIALLILHRRRKKRRGAGTGEDRVGPAIDESSPGDAARALLDSPELANGDWKGLYAAMDRLLRELAAAGFGLPDQRAMTHRQMRDSLRSGEPRRAEFLESAESLMSEISMQRYADWGTTRDRAESDLRLLGSLMDEWWPRS